VERLGRNAPGASHRQSGGWGQHGGEGGVTGNAPWKWGDPNSGMPSAEVNEEWVQRRGLRQYKPPREGWYVQRGFPDKPPAGGALSGLLAFGLGQRLADALDIHLPWPSSSLSPEVQAGSFGQGLDTLLGAVMSPALDLLSGEYYNPPRPRLGPAFGPKDELDRMTEILPLRGGR
jgi:hypothetical protein